jgi:opacity protein-like surface antigen
MKLFKKITFLMVLLVATTSLAASAETEDEESYNTGILSNDELPTMEFDFGPSADAVIPGGGPGTVPGFNDNAEDVPVDGGISILLGAGLAYGAARLRKKKEDTDLFI